MNGKSTATEKNFSRACSRPTFTNPEDGPNTHVPSRYNKPRTLLFRTLPDLLVPYAELMRLHKSAGYFAFAIPHLFGTLFASAIISPAPKLAAFLTTNGLLFGGSFFLRGAACTWNDVVDRDYDRKVERCRNRPIARNAVSQVQGIAFMIIQIGLGVGGFLRYLRRDCLIPAGLLTISQMVYPFFKRFTHFPQVWLGFSLACGQFVGATTLGVNAIGTMARMILGGESTVEDRRLVVSAGGLYIAGILNTLIYDTIYGHQDLNDDLKAGVKSVAVAWREKTKSNCIILIGFEAGALAVAGYMSDFGLSYFVSAVGLTSVVMATLLSRVNLEDPESCMSCFNSMIALTGVTLTAGLLSEYWGNR